jgi:hypothetical protein
MIPRDYIVVAVGRNDPVVPHVDDRVIPDFVVVCKAQPDRIETIPECIIVYLVPRAE